MEQITWDDFAVFVSEVLTTGFILENNNVVLARPEQKVPNGFMLA